MLDALEPYALQKVFAGTVWWHLQVLRGGGFAVFSGAGTFLTWRCGPCEKGIPASLHLQPEVEYNVYIYSTCRCHGSSRTYPRKHKLPCHVQSENS